MIPFRRNCYLIFFLILWNYSTVTSQYDGKIIIEIFELKKNLYRNEEAMFFLTDAFAKLNHFVFDEYIMKNIRIASS